MISTMSGQELDRAERVAALRQVPLFRRLSKATIYELARRTSRSAAPAGATLVRQGEPGDHLGVFISGTADVIRDGRLVGSFAPGDFYGEMSLIDGEPRSATITVTGDAVVLKVAAEDFDALLRIPDVARAMLKEMSARLREPHQHPPI